MESRRAFLSSTLAVAAQSVVASALPPHVRPDSDVLARAADAPKQRPNIIVYLSDQFRWDFVGANGQNGSTRTPNLDAMAARGTNFSRAVTNQPLCAPARRACGITHAPALLPRESDLTAP